MALKDLSDDSCMEFVQMDEVETSERELIVTNENKLYFKIKNPMIT